jgi:phosphotransferase system enzyme I (PtsI)
VNAGSDPGGSAPSLLELRFQGTAASSGIAIGRAVIISAPHKRLLHWRVLASSERPAEVERYQRARTLLLDSIQESLTAATPLLRETRTIIETYELIVTDPVLEDTIRSHILSDGMPAEVAVTAAYDAHIQLVASAHDPLLRERRYDLENLRQKFVELLRSTGPHQQQFDGAIIVAASLLASDVVRYHQHGIRGIVTEVGGITSHACIVARTLGIPAVIGVRHATALISEGATVIVDGSRGVVVAQPTAQTLERYHRLQQDIRAQQHQSRPLEPVTTADGIAIPVYASIDSPDEVPTALEHGADGIGLVRTEMLLVRLQHFPSEQEQYIWYKTLAERAYSKPVTLRVFDVGSDKMIHGMPHEPNPALGLRGVRFLLRRRDLFRSQLRAILRASVHRNVRLLLPMITSVEELIETLGILRQIKAELESEGQPFDDRIPIGAMIETPAAALLAEHLAAHVHFFSIGTNDLTQYTLAADRTSELVAHIFDQLNPAVLRLLDTVSAVAARHGIELELCGDLATFLSATELLIGLGIRAFSVAPIYIPALKHRIATVDSRHARAIVRQALECHDSASVHALLADNDKPTTTESQHR